MQFDYSNHLKQNRELIQQTIEELRPHWKDSEKCCYYPSSGNHIRRVFELDSDIFFFSDKMCCDLGIILPKQIPNVKLIVDSEFVCVFKSSHKIGYFLKLENNIALEVIREFSPYLNLFLGFRDGCCEGGNSECTNNPPFLQKIVQFSPPEGMSLLVDHSKFLDRNEEYIFGSKYIKFIGNLSQVFNRHPIGPTRHYQVTEHKPIVHEWKKSNIRLTVEFDNILNHIHQLDGIIGSHALRRQAIINRCFRSQKFFIPQGYFFRPHEKEGWSADKSLDLSLTVLEKKKWKTVGLTAFGQGDHKNFLDILAGKYFTCQVWLRFFHVSRDDFHGLIEQIEN